MTAITQQTKEVESATSAGGNRKRTRQRAGSETGAPSVPQGIAAAGLPRQSQAAAAGLPRQSHAAAAGGGLSSEELVRRSNFWRDNYNPLRGLTIARLLALFEQAERGAFAEIQLTLRKTEKRFPVLKGFMEKLLSSIEILEGKVRVREPLPAGGTAELAEAQRKLLQTRYDLLRNFKTSIAQLALADIRGYAVLQKHRFPEGANAGAVEELYWLEPWCWARDGFYGDFYYNEDSRFGVGLGSCAAILGEECRIGSAALPRSDFVLQEAESPLYEIALIAFVNWLMGRRDYAAFVEVFGLPNAVVILPANIPPGREMEYQAAAEKVARGVSGALAAGSEVRYPGQGVRGDNPYGGFCEAQEKDVVLAGTAGHLTMLSLPTGIGKGASEEHDEAWRKIALVKAAQINNTLQRDFDAPELAAAFPGQPVCVEFALRIKDEEDVGVFLDNAVKGVGLGFEVEAAELSERSGIKFTKPKEKAEIGKAESGNPANPLAGVAARADRSVDIKIIKAAVRNSARVSRLEAGAPIRTGAPASQPASTLHHADRSERSQSEAAAAEVRLTAR